ncbi:MULTISPECIES: ATP-binding cassette domain-containing protein [unclassified Streptomyces]|uniref:ATP-binding cassette domain-containing protein n=1 Tax=unclassified Streptomyces TaxID=2593676 RepID=UPI0032D59AE6
MPLRWRLALLFALGTAVVIATAGLLFVHQLTAALNSSLDTALRARADAQVVRLASSGPLPPLVPAPPQSQDGSVQGDQQGQHPVSDEVAQVLSPGGAVLESSDPGMRQPLLNASQLQVATRGPGRFTATVEGEGFRLLAVPARNASQPVVVVVGAGTQIVDAATARTSTALWLAGPPAVALAGLGAYLLAGAALHPVERMRRHLADISGCDTGARLRVPSRVPSAVAAAVERVGLGEKAKAKLRTLSGGMLRRVGIAQAIVNEPELLLLDEPTAGLDPEQRVTFRTLLRDLGRTSTVVVSTHLVEDVGAACSHVVLMYDGKFAFRGTPAELVARGDENSAGDAPLERGYSAVLSGARS